MQNNKRILVIGEVYTDNHIDANFIRLGGIFHSARALDALQANYALAAVLPNYLEEDFNTFAKKLNATAFKSIGEIKRSPNVINIHDSKETGSQGYEDILRKQAKTSMDISAFLELFKSYKPTDLIVYPGKYDLASILNEIKNEKIRIHVDFQYGEELLPDFKNNKYNFETLIFSTTSKLFLDTGGTLLELLNSDFSYLANYILLKENRGGSTLINTTQKFFHEAPSFNILNTHSVGVGDCFNSAYVFYNMLLSEEHCLKIASFTAREYASTFNHDDFKDTVKLIKNEEILETSGVRISWESRQKMHIYLAGPDFPMFDTKLFDKIEDILEYHNFVPHRPIKENGLFMGNESYKERQEIYNKDVELLKKCELMIAILIEDDPGTFVEIGWMNHAGKPIILFDPYKKAYNLFLTKSVTRIVHTIDELLLEVFNLLNQSVEEFTPQFDSLLLMSGGLDSTTLAYELLEQNKSILPVFLDYGQHFKEKELNSLLKVIPQKIKPYLRVVNIKDIYKNSSSRMIIEPNLWMENVNSDDLYLPYRNLLFLTIASSIAQSEDITKVYAAFINSNHAKEIDCSKEFFDKLGVLLNDYGSVEICLPYRDLSKAEVIQRGIRLNVPMAITYSCQANSEVPCGVCPNCVDRENAISFISTVNVDN
ncbi:7-cyano-7-deazaguanine synthase [Ureibacillus massiliensis]|nr:7-cyano-7-deazaguanine synthase [Ureibacillus massiliensis]